MSQHVQELIDKIKSEGIQTAKQPSIAGFRGPASALRSTTSANAGGHRKETQHIERKGIRIVFPPPPGGDPGGGTLHFLLIVPFYLLIPGWN